MMTSARAEDKNYWGEMQTSCDVGSRRGGDGRGATHKQSYDLVSMRFEWRKYETHKEFWWENRLEGSYLEDRSNIHQVY
jgi:hypothetical protein